MSKRRRRYGSLVRFPGMGFLPKLPSAVKPVDVALGVALGLAGAVGIAKATSALAAGGTSVPSVITDNATIFGGVASAGLLYVAQKKKNPSRAAGHAIGALLGSIAVWGYNKLQTSGMLAGMVRFPGMGGQIFSNPRLSGWGGQIVSNPRLSGFNGPIFTNPQTNLNLHRLSQLQGLGDDNEDGMFPAP